MTTTSAAAAFPPTRLWGRTAPEWLVSLPTITLLLLILIIGTGEMIHGQLLKLGESMFKDPAGQVQYFMLRADPVSPDCNPALNIDAELARLQAVQPDKASADDVDSLFTDQAAQDPVQLRKSIESTVALCQSKHAQYAQVIKHLTPGLKAYRAVETSFFGLFRFGSENRPLILLLLLTITSIATTWSHHHICLRPPKFERDFRVQSITMALASGLLLHSAIRYFQISTATGVRVEEPWLYYLWMLMFAALLLISGTRVLWPAKQATQGLGTWAHAAQSTPIVASMGLIAGVYFLLHNHPSGLAIYVSKLMDIPNLPLQLALYIWAGMLLKQSRLVDLFMNILRPWRFSPEMLTYLILLAAALPTAYSGASGVFVIAAGAIIYHEVRAVGGSSQYALAATAMSGSLGVVLRPSLLVVGITMLNKEVTSDQLFHWGGYVFALTSTLFFLVSQLHRTQRANVASPRDAVPQMLRQIVPILPHVAVVMAVVGFYSTVLETPLNEISAPTIIPVIMIIVLTIDKWLAARDKAPTAPQPSYAAHRQTGVEASIRAATSETVGHIGAYLGLMMLSQTIGGVVERSEIIDLAPHQFSSVWAAMAFLMVTKVILGTVMEPIGAIFLVSGTLAPIAYHNGIHPVHFWMMVLVAFELGYLLPPVALNQLLTRQVVGEQEIDASDHAVANASFMRRYERWILPVLVMSVSLVIVAFGPLAVQQFEWLRFLR
jgi:TRAP-type C4-dicarboxylate transport system permease large subunit